MADFNGRRSRRAASAITSAGGRLDSNVSGRRIFGLVVFLSAAHFSHHVLTALLIPLLPFIRSDFGLSYTQTGVVAAIFTIAYGFAQLPGGWLADRTGPGLLLLLSISGVAIAGGLVGATFGYASLLTLLFVMGLMGGGYHPAASLVISQAVPPKPGGGRWDST